MVTNPRAFIEDVDFEPLVGSLEEGVEDGEPLNLDQLPSTGFTVSCFPVKIERASAGWTRAVAIIDS